MTLDKINLFIQLFSGAATIVSFYLTLHPKDNIGHKYLLVIFVLGTLGFFFKNTLSIQIFRIITFFQKRSKSTILVNVRRIKLSFVENTGSLVHFFEETYFEKIAKNGLHTSRLWADGKIDLSSIKSNNCTYEVRSPQEIRIYYLNGKTVNNSFFRSMSYYAYSANLLDSYCSTRESWSTGFENPTKEFHLELSFSYKRPPLNPRLYRLDGGNKIAIETVPIVVKTIDTVNIQVKMFNLGKKDKFVIEWDWPQKKRPRFLSWSLK